MVSRRELRRSRQIPGGSGGFVTHCALSAGLHLSMSRAGISLTVEDSNIVGDMSALATDMFEVFGGTSGELCVSDTARSDSGESEGRLVRL